VCAYCPFLRPPRSPARGAAEIASIDLTGIEYLFDSKGMGAEIAQVISLSPVALSPVRHRDDVLTGEGLLPVLPALRGLLPGGGLQRGSVVTSGDWGLLALALTAGAVADGAWCAIVGVPAFGVRAAAEADLDPDRILLVGEPGPSWPQVVASLLDGFDIVLLRPPDQPSAQLRRKLEAAARRYGSVLVVAGDWPGAQSRLLVTDTQWIGMGAGHGRLRARKAQVVASGRGAGERPRSAWLWLPGPDGAVTMATGISGLADASSRDKYRDGAYQDDAYHDATAQLVSSG
jgi:hypothetical protein